MVKKTLVAVLTLVLFSCDYFLVGDFPAYMPLIKSTRNLSEVLASAGISINDHELVSANLPPSRMGKNWVTLHLRNKTTNIWTVIALERKNLQRAFHDTGLDIFRYDDMLGLTTSSLVMKQQSWFLSHSPPTVSLTSPSSTERTYTTSAKIISINYVHQNNSYYFSYEVNLYPFNLKLKIATTDPEDLNEISTKTASNLPIVPPSYASFDAIFPLQALKYSDSQVAVLLMNASLQQGAVALYSVDHNLLSDPSFHSILIEGIPCRGDPYIRKNWLVKQGAVCYLPEEDSAAFYPFLDASLDNKIVFSRLQGLRPLGFSEDGTEWMGYDRKTQKLYLLHTWWP